MTSTVMPYSRDTTRLIVDPPLFTFPGDEKLSQDQYKAAMTNTYLRKVPLAGAFMAQFNVPFEAEDRERTKRLMVSMGWLDHLLDETPDRKAALAVYRDLLQSLTPEKQSPAIPDWARPELRDSMALVHNATRSLPAEYVQGIVVKALRIGAISVEKSASPKVKEYAVILTEEGALSSDLVIECLSASAHNADGYFKLHQWNQKAMTAATLLDAAIDLKQDYADSLTHVQPTIISRVYLFWRAFTYIPLLVRGLGIRGIKTVAKIGVN